MALPERNLIIDLRQPIARAIDLLFTAELTGSDGEVLTAESFNTTVNADGTLDATGDNKLPLPCKSEGTIEWTLESSDRRAVPRTKFFLAYEDGSDILLSELVAAGGAATQTTLDYVNSTAVRFDTAQTLSDPQKAQARDNIGVSDGADSVSQSFQIPGNFPQCSFPAAYIVGAASGNNDLYTVPTGRKALVQDIIVTNVSGGAVGYYPQVKIGATYYKIGQDVSESNNVFGHNYGMVASKNAMPIVLHEGEAFSLNCTAAGLTIWANVIEFDDSSPLSRADIQNWSAGQNTLLTVPVNKTVHIGGVGFSSNNNPAASLQGLNYLNNSGSMRSITGIYIVPSGGSPAANNTFATSNTVANGLGFTKFFPGCLSPGDSIVIDVDSGATGQFMWCNYFAV